MGGVPVAPEHNAADIEHDIKILDDLAKQLRERRFHNGAVSVESPHLTFKLDENGMPGDCGFEGRTDANRLVEEVSQMLSDRSVPKLMMLFSSCWRQTLPWLNRSLFTSLNRLFSADTITLLTVAW